MDGVGEWATTSAWLGEGKELTPLWEIPFPHSLGLLYSAFTYYTGFKVNSGEYKVMGLAPYGRPQYVQAIYEHLMDLKPDGTFRLNMEYFDYCTGLTMTGSRFDELFGGPPRKPETRLTQREMDLARSVQDVTEEVMLRLAGRSTGRRGPRTSAWPGESRSTAWGTDGSSARGRSRGSGSRPRPAMPAGRSALRSRRGTSSRASLGRPTAPTRCRGRCSGRPSRTRRSSAS